MKDRREFLKSLGLAAATAAAAPMAGAEGIRMGRRRAGKPNVILIVSDEHQANTCGCYGSKVRQVGGKSPTPPTRPIPGCTAATRRRLVSRQPRMPAGRMPESGPVPVPW